MNDAYRRAARQQEYAGGLTAIALLVTLVLVVLFVVAVRLGAHHPVYVVRGANAAGERNVSWWW